MSAIEPRTVDATATQLREARVEIEALKTDNARLRGALQEAIAVAEQLSGLIPGNSPGWEVLAPLKALAQAVQS